MEGGGPGSYHSPVPQNQSPDGPAMPQIVNIVASIDLGCTMNLQELAAKAENVEYSPREFNGLKMRLRQPDATALIFPSGRVVVTGVKTEASSRIACRKLAQILRNLGYTAGVSDWRVRNMVAAAQMPFLISLERLDIFGAEGIVTSYEPELWPGLILRMRTPHKMTFMVFHSGKVVIMGFTDRQQLNEGFQLLVPILTRFRK